MTTTTPARLNVTIADGTVTLSIGADGPGTRMAYSAARALVRSLLADVETAGRDGRTDVSMRLTGQTVTLTLHSAIELAERILEQTGTTP